MTNLLGSENKFPIIRMLEDPTPPTTPASGIYYVYVDEATKTLHGIDDAGTDIDYGDAGSGYTPGGTDVAVADGGTGASSASAARTNLGLVIGTDVLALHGPTTYLDVTEAAAPSTPASGAVRLYAKADGRVYSKDDAGVEYGPFDAAGGGAGGPLLYIDSTALHADGDEMDDDTLALWTLGGGLTTGDVTAITSELYDDTCLDIVFGAQGDRMLRTIPSWTYIYMTFHGITNAASAYQTAAGAMMALSVVDSNGDGTGISVYDDTSVYLWGIDNYNYTATGPQVSGSWLTPKGGAAFPSDNPIVLRLRKSGTSIFGAVSYDGGVRWNETSARTDALTHDRFGIIRLFSNGGTNPTLRVGRIQVA